MASIIVAGSTGAIGCTVVKHAMRNSKIAKVVALTRQSNVTVDMYEKVFGIDNETAANAEFTAKVCPTTFNWEDFLSFWASYASAVRADPRVELPEALARQLAVYQPIFSGHTYGAMCLGTTRADAGSAKQFIRCDYDYVLAFTEALLAFSAPCGFLPPSQALSAEEPKTTKVVDDGFVYHIADDMKGAEMVNMEVADKASGAACASLRSRSSQTLQVLVNVSAYNSKPDSWFLYMKTKGRADAGVMERVIAHNRHVRMEEKKRKEKGGGGGVTKGDGESAVSCTSAVKCSMVMPGFLDRGEKSRGMEKAMLLIAKGIPVDTCGAAVVSDCVLHDHGDAGKAAKAWEGEVAAPLFGPAEKAKKEASSGTVVEPIFGYYDKHLRTQAAALVGEPCEKKKKKK